VSRALSAVLGLLLLATAAAPVAATEPDGATTNASVPAATAGAVIPGRVIVRWRTDADAAAVVRTRGLAVLSELAVPGSSRAQLLATDGRAVDQVLAELRADPAVAYAEPDYTIALAVDPAPEVVVNDPQTADQYSLSHMRVRDAWGVETGGAGKIAVLDTGVQSAHPDLSGRVLAGYDFVNDDSNAGDDNGHGTWVAGIIAAKVNDGYGIAGISWSDKILPVKIMSREGTGSSSDLASGIIWAADHGATVINMSVGGFPYSQYVQDAVTYAWNKGAVLVGAAGNNRREEVFYPASMTNVVSVSATQVNDEFSNWSSWGPNVDVSAPGSSVLTTNCTTCTYADHHTWGSHVYISGTSFATPNVAGVVALIRARYPDYTPQQVVSRLVNTVDDLGYGGWDKKYGHGRVNALRALGGSVAYASVSGGDALEPNNSIGGAKWIPLGNTTRPSIYPAADVDMFAVEVPRAGRLDVRVRGVVDTRAYPWHKSGLPVDPVVELLTTSGTLLARVDNEYESGVELAQTTVSGPTRIVVRVTNWYANGNRTAYEVTPSFVDTVAPAAALAAPVSGTVGVSRFVEPVITFSEAVTGVSASSLRLRDTTTNELVPAAVTYDPATRQARLAPTVTRLAPAHGFRIEALSTIVDVAGNAVASASRTFTTGTASFTDTAGTAFETSIEWAFASEIASGCTATRFCPTQSVTRAEMATFLTRALDLPPASVDWFTDDAGHSLEGNINRVATAGLTKGCTATRFCPESLVTRAQMASFLVRALQLPPTTVDAFTDDNWSGHEDAINRLAAAGIGSGCTATTYCPSETVTREQMAAFLKRAFGD
jgi:type VII secretion-associated serine protease mycosin